MAAFVIFPFIVNFALFRNSSVLQFAISSAKESLRCFSEYLSRAALIASGARSSIVAPYSVGDSEPIIEVAFCGFLP